jgi:hypothetical protein
LALEPASPLQSETPTGAENCGKPLKKKRNFRFQVFEIRFRPELENRVLTVFVD